MRIDHGCLYVFVPEELLNSPNIVSILQKMYSERVSKRVAPRPLCHSRSDARFFPSFLDQRLIHVMSVLLSGSRVLPAFALGNNPLPLPFHSCVRILSVKSIRHPTVNPCLLSAHYKGASKAPIAWVKTFPLIVQISLRPEEKATRIKRLGASDWVMKCPPLRRYRTFYSDETPFHGSPCSRETIRS